MPPLILDARGRSSLFTHLPLLFRHLPICIFSENSVVGCPPAGCPGPSHPSHPPLHATAPRDRHSQGAYTNIRCCSAVVGYTGDAVRLKYRSILAMLFS